MPAPEDGAAVAGTHSGVVFFSARLLKAGRVRLVLIGGLPGTGKSTLAARIGEALGAVVLRTDELRKQLAGPDPATPAVTGFGQGLYAPEMTGQTYRELLDRARSLLAGGRSVVADASWHDPAWRDRARALAMETSADLAEFRCVLPLELIVRRIMGRAAAGDASDVTVAVVRRLAASLEPWPTAAEIDTTPPPGDVALTVLRDLGAGPAAAGDGAASPAGNGGAAAAKGDTATQGSAGGPAAPPTATGPAAPGTAVPEAENRWQAGQRR